MDLGLLAGGAVTTLEAALKQPADRPRMKMFPADPRVGEPVVVMAVPPKSVYNTAAIPVCLEQNGRILGKWTISTAGQVSPDFQSVASSEQTPCNPWLVPQGMAWMQQQGVPIKAQDAAKQ
jgi:hypothetical protein